jgi:hypothetical protein
MFNLNSILLLALCFVFLLKAEDVAFSPITPIEGWVSGTEVTVTVR